VAVTVPGVAVSLNSFKYPNALVGNTKMPDVVSSAGAVLVTSTQVVVEGDRDSYSFTVAPPAFTTCSVLYRNNSLFTQSWVVACAVALDDAFKLTSVTTVIVVVAGIAISNPGDIVIEVSSTGDAPIVTL